jgi:SSS family solute:Na+ symporter
VNVSVGPIDLAVIGVYLVGIVAVGCAAGLWIRRGQAEASSYFLAGGTLTWPVIGLALFSTNISTIHLVSFAQEGYDNGLAYGNFEWMAPFTLIVTSLFFAPFYIRSRVATLPDFVEMRYNRHCRDLLAVLSIVAAICIHIGFSLYTGAIVLQGMFGIPLLHSIIVIAALTGLYTIVGGLMAVVVTESIQTVILLAGAIVITAIAYWKVGGFSGIHETLEAHNELVKMTVLRSADDASRLPWYSVFLGYPVIGIWYWCADQTIVQRVLGAKDENHARIGPLFAGFIKILPVFIFVLPGLIFFVLVRQGAIDEAKLENLPIGQQVTLDGREVSVTDQRLRLEGRRLEAAGRLLDVEGKNVYVEDGVLYVNGHAEKNTKAIYSVMIQELLPVGLKGVVAAALLAALMSTVSGALNSIATLFSYDIVKRWRPATTDHQLVFIGRVTTLVAMVAAIVWSPFIDQFGSVFQAITAIICYIAPPITAVFLWGVFWRRASGVAAVLTFYLGSALGLAVFVLDYFKVSWWKVPSMMATFYLFIACSSIMLLVSLVKPHEHTAQSEILVWDQPLAALSSPGWRGLGNYKVLAALLFATMVVLYVIFA